MRGIIPRLVSVFFFLIIIRFNLSTLNVFLLKSEQHLVPHRNMSLIYKINNNSIYAK